MKSKINNYNLSSWFMTSDTISSNYSYGYTDYKYTPSTEDILNQLDFREIESYVRKKKIERVTEKTIKRRK